MRDPLLEELLGDQMTAEPGDHLTGEAQVKSTSAI
jgi:hypothetical protein